MSWINLKTNKFQSSANQNGFNTSSNCCWRATREQHISLAVSSSLSQLWLPAHASDTSKRRSSCLGQGCSQQYWTVESISAAGPWSLFPDHRTWYPLKIMYLEESLHPQSPRPRSARSPPPATRTIGTWSTRLKARPEKIMMKTWRQSTRLALLLDAEEVTRWWLLGFEVEDDSQDQRGANSPWLPKWFC